MKLRHLIIISFVLTVLTIGAACACDDLNATLSAGEAENMGDGDSVQIDIGDVIVPDSEDYIGLSLPEDARGMLSVKVDNGTASLEKIKNDDDEYIINVKSPNSGSAIQISADEDEEWLICLDSLPLGKYNITVDYADFLKPSYNAHVQKTVTICNPEDEISLEKTYVYHDAESRIMIPQSLMADLKVFINTNNYPITNGYVDLSRLELGTYSIVITSKGRKIIDSTFNIGGIITAPESFTYKSSQAITLNLPEDATGSLVVMLDGSVISNQKLADGHAHYSLDGLITGSYGFRAIYDGDDYDVDDFEKLISVNPIVNIPSSMVVGENRYVTFEFGDGCSGQIRIEADMAYYASARVVNGRASVSLAGLEDGDVELYIVFNGNDGFRFDGIYTVEVASKTPRIVGLKNIKMQYGDAKTLKLTVWASNGRHAEKEEDFEIIIGKTSYDLEVGKNGVVKFKIDVAPGKYRIRAVYNDVSVEGVLIVKHLLKLKKVNVKKSAKRIVLKATLKKGMVGKKIVFKFNGKKFSAKTNKNGVAKVVIKSSLLSKLKVGKKITYQATYLKDSVKYKVKVKK